MVKNLSANTGDVRDTGLMPESERSHGGGYVKPLQYSCLEDPIDRGEDPGRIQSIGLQRTRHN